MIYVYIYLLNFWKCCVGLSCKIEFLFSLPVILVLRFCHVNDCSSCLNLLQRDNIIEIFYEKHLSQLIDVITASCLPEGIAQSAGDSTGSGGRVESTKPEILSNICELLCFCVLHHPYRIK